MLKKYLISAFICSLIVPQVSLAGHRSNYSRVDISDLDDDPVEEVPIPVLFGVELDEVIPDFGDPRGGGTREHEGQDFMVPFGTPIVSPTEAVVITTGTGVSAGKFVYTANPGGEIFRYMHLDEIADIERGDELDVGDLIGTVGDTGNAESGSYHLHFEIRDEDNDATDPYPRLGEAFTLKEKMSFMRNIIRNFRKSERDDYAELLVETFTADFREALRQDYSLPDEIEEAMEDLGVVGTVQLENQLNELIASIPGILDLELRVGDSGAAVQLLQIFIIYTGEGPARADLAAAGPTGYFGSITEAAIKEYQSENDLLETGIYNKLTKEEMEDYAK